MRIPGFSRRNRPKRKAGSISSYDSLSVTRRDFIAGTASTVAVAGSAHAETTAIEFAIQESETEITIRFRNERCLAPLIFNITKDYWSRGVSASTAAMSTPAKSTSPKFVVTAAVGKPMPDGSNRQTAKIEIQNAGFAGLKNPFSVKFVFQLLDQNCQLALTTTGWPRPGTTKFAPIDFVEFMAEGRLQFALSAGETSNLVQSLFGRSVKSEAKADLAVDSDLSWTLSGPFSMTAGLDPSSTSRLRFDRLRFAPTSRDTKAFAKTNPFAKEILGVAFPKLYAKSDADFSPPPGMAGYSEGALVETTAAELGTYGKILVTANSNSTTTAAFLQFGETGAMVSGVTGDFEVWVKQEKVEEGPFLTEGGAMVRYGAGGSLGFARMPIASKSFDVTTAHGRFSIEAADPVVPQPNADQVKPGVVLSAENGQLKSFEISGLIRQAFIPFPADAAGPKRTFFSRLDFAGADCKFVLDPLADLTPLYSSGSFIRLCAPSDAPAGRDPVWLGLDQAVLRVVRPDDLLSLKFRFSGLALTSGGRASKIVPLRAGACGVHLAEKVNEARRSSASLSERFLPGAAVDDRPIMVVEFPPQHVAERAYFQRVNDGADPPDVALSDDSTKALACWLDVLDKYRRGIDIDLDQRIAARREVQIAKCLAEKAQTEAQASSGGNDGQAPDSGAKTDAKPRGPASTVSFQRFCGSFEREIEWQPLSSRWPDDQKIYIGPEWLDLDVRRFARELAAKMAREAAEQSSNAFRTNSDSTANTGTKPPPLIDEAVRERLPAIDVKDPDFRNWAAAYDRWGERLFGGLPRYCGPDSVQALVDTGQINNATLAMLVAKIEAEIDGPEDFSANEPTEARLCGPTRLAFRINCNDFEPGGGSFAFTLADLTNWSRFDLSVVRRAEKLLDFDSSGKLPPHWARKEILDPSSLLLHQGIHPARNWLPGANSQRVSLAQRMAEVYASANTRPLPLETAIELPFRLTLSPAQDARWRTPALPPRAESPIPLWQASLEENVSRSSLRAIWSEDFQPDVLRDGTPPPPHGVWAPWDPPVPQDDGSPPHSNRRFRAVMDAGDRHELVTLSSVYGLPVNGRRDSSLHLPSDGDQLEPPPGYRLLDLPDDTDAIYSPRALNVTELALSALGGSVSLDTHFQPPAGVKPKGRSDRLFVLDVERWRHTAVLGRDISVEVVYKGFLFPLGNRVSFVKVTERRFMRHPTGGPTAYLIQRKFLKVGSPKKTFPALGQANLGRCFPPQTINILTRRTPDIVDPTDRPSARWTDFIHEYANGAVTFTNDENTPLPGLVFWPRTSPSESSNVRFEVQIDDTGGSVSMPMLFVDNLAAHTPETVAALTNYYNRQTMESKRTVLHGGTPRRYAVETKQGDSTFETLNWILMAEGGGDTSKYPGPYYNKNFVLSSPLESADQPPFYPYLDTCLIRLNQVGKFTGGQAPVTAARYYSQYLARGFPDDANSSETFLQTVPTPAFGLPPMAFGSSGDRAAGVGRPENQIVALSRQNGPIGGSKPLEPPPRPAAPPTAGPAQSKAVQGSQSTTTTLDSGDYATLAEFDPSKFNPTSFFGSFGKLLGIIDLGKVIQAAADLTGMPQLSETIDYASTQGWDIVRQTILQPLSDVLDTLDKTWASMNVGAGETALDQIGKAFPDIRATETALRAAVNKALSATAPPIDQQAQLLGVVYEKARAFIQALQRMAADPLGPIAMSLKKQVDVLGDTLTGEIKTALSNAVDDIGTALAGEISDWFSKQSTIDLLCALGALLDALTDSAIKDKIRETFAIKLKNHLGDDCAKWNATSHNVFSETLQDQDVRNALQNEPQDIQNALMALADVADDSIWEGNYFTFLAPMLCSLKTSAQGFVSTAEKASVAAVAQLAAGALDLLGNISQFLNLRPLAIDVCSNSISAAIKFLRATKITDNKVWAFALRKCVDEKDLCVGGRLQSLLDQGASLLSIQPAPPGQPALSQVLLETLQKLVAAPSDLKTWADGLLEEVRPSIKAIADELLAIQDEGSLPGDEEVSSACGSPAGTDLNKLKILSNDLLPRLARRRRLTKSAVGVQQAVASALREFPTNTKASMGRDVIVAAGKLESLLLDQVVRFGGSALNEALSMLDSLDASQPGGHLVPVDVATKALNDAINAIADLINDTPIDARKISDLVRAAEAAILGDPVAAMDQMLAKASGILLKMLHYTKDLIEEMVPIVSRIAGLLREVNKQLNTGAMNARDGLKSLASNPTAAAALQPLMQQISAPLGDLIKDTTAADRSLSNSYLYPTPGQLADLSKISDAVAVASRDVANVANDLKRTAEAVMKIGQAVLKGQIARLIDINAPRREIESLIRDLVPHKATMAYSLDTQLTSFADVFIPDLDRGSGKLKINTTAVVDLLSPVQTPQTTVKGVLDPFKIHLFGNSFDVVTLKFKQAQFGSSPGSSFKFTIDLEDVVLGEMVAFLQELQSYLTPSDGNGFYLRPASGSPGIEVGYGLNLGTISLGPVSFINVSLNAGCRLPFDKSNALFTISLSRPDSPFLISVGIYGGGGYLALIADGKSIVGFEASFEFGGVSAFSFGPLNGIGMLTTGIFLRKLYDKTTIEGFFFCGGSARIACFGISASLMVSISMEEGGAMVGQAVFTFSFSIGFAHIDFHITVFKTQAKLGGSASVAPIGPSRTRFAELASDLPPARLATQPSHVAFGALKPPRFFATTMSPNRDWGQYRRYFATDIKPRWTDGE